MTQRTRFIKIVVSQLLIVIAAIGIVLLIIFYALFFQCFLSICLFILFLIAGSAIGIVSVIWHCIEMSTPDHS